MKIRVPKVSSALTHLRDARDSHQYGGTDPWQVEARRSGAVEQNLRKAPEYERASLPRVA